MIEELIAYVILFIAGTAIGVGLNNVGFNIYRIVFRVLRKLTKIRGGG